MKSCANIANLHPAGPAQRQRGAVTLAAALAVILMIAAAVMSILAHSGSTVIDASEAEKQTAALFLSESGVERAQAAIAKSIVSDSGYQDTTCTGLVTGSRITMGRGTFGYDAATSVPPACGGYNSPCTECNFVVSGQVDSARRRVRSQIQATFNQGVHGHGDQFTLQMNSLRPGGAALSNLAYRATATLATDISSNASVGACVNTGGACDISAYGWDLQRTGTNNVSNMGVYAPVSASGYQTLTTSLITSSKSPAARNYVHTGIFFYPLVTGSLVDFKGRYAATGGNSPTASTSQTSGTLPSTWHCGGTTSATAAESDTLVYGFSSKPVSAARQLDGVRFGGVQGLGGVQMRRMVNLTGMEGDFLYSQIWFTWNRAYSTSATAAGAGTTITLSPATSALPAVGTTLGVRAGTGAFGSADLTGSVSGNVLTVTAVSSGSLEVGDVLYGRYLAPGVRVTGRLTGTGGTGTYSVCTLTQGSSCAGQEASPGPITARVGVVSTGASGTFVVSRAPTTALSGATLCGGVCALMYGASGASTRDFGLANITSGDDWASGFLCLAGVDPSSVQILGYTTLKRTYWAEPVQ
ncbi:MAG: hypothetical protein ACOVK6_01100 [Ramlibacter sp.]